MVQAFIEWTNGFIIPHRNIKRLYGNILITNSDGYVIQILTIKGRKPIFARIRSSTIFDCFCAAFKKILSVNHSYKYWNQLWKKKSKNTSLKKAPQVEHRMQPGEFHFHGSNVKEVHIPATAQVASVPYKTSRCPHLSCQNRGIFQNFFKTGVLPN